MVTGFVGKTNLLLRMAKVDPAESQETTAAAEMPPVIAP